MPWGTSTAYDKNVDLLSIEWQAPRRVWFCLFEPEELQLDRVKYINQFILKLEKCGRLDYERLQKKGSCIPGKIKSATSDE